MDVSKYKKPIHFTCPEIEEEEYFRGMSLEEMAECCKLKFNT